MTNVLSETEAKEFIQAFAEEGFELLTEVEPLLLELEGESGSSQPLDPEKINTIFRLFHSLKGGAGFLGLTTIGLVTHEAETLLDIYRNEIARLHTKDVTLLIKTCDFIHQLLDHIKENHSDAAFREEAESLAIELRGAAQNAKAHKEKKKGAMNRGDAAVSINRVQRKRSPSAGSVKAENSAKELLKLLDEIETSFQNLAENPDQNEILSQVSDSIRIFNKKAEACKYDDLHLLSARKVVLLEKIIAGENQGSGEIYALLVEIVDSMKNSVKALIKGDAPKITGLNGWLNLLQDAENQIVEGTLQKARTLDQSQSSGSPAGIDRRAVSDRRQMDRRSMDSLSVRIDLEKLDKLENLVGELVIAEAMVTQNPDIRQVDSPMFNFEKSVVQLKKVIHDLQETASDMRMVTLSGMFKKMTRLVRDLSLKAGKKIELETSGEETEVDKSLIERISDPLVHLIRNAVDHGIETPAEREGAGKRPAGTISLEAQVVDGEIRISVRDDGRGLNRERIIAKATERGLCNRGSATLKEEEVWQFLFHPGFSTAEEVTELSGRGVGLDVVRKNLESMRGRVDVQSKSGRGCTFTLHIPLTLAIIDGMTVRVEENRYILPIAYIRESLRAGEQKITHLPDGREIVNIRGKILPVIRLYRLLNLMHDFGNPSEGIFIIVENLDKSVCLFVDELVEQNQVVVKSLPKVFGSISLISGCAISGIGEIRLILDVAGILDMYMNSSNQTAQKTDMQSVGVQLATVEIQ